MTRKVVMSYLRKGLFGTYDGQYVSIPSSTMHAGNRH